MRSRLIPLSLAALAAGVLAHGLHGAGLLRGSDAFFTDWLYTGLMWGTAAVCLARGIALRHERFAWLALGAYLGLTAVGDTSGRSTSTPSRARRTRT